jgi:CheY-like chemotaxis protein
MKNTPEMALTAHALLACRNRALGSGFDDRDIKPVGLPPKVKTILNKEATS